MLSATPRSSASGPLACGFLAALVFLSGLAAAQQAPPEEDLERFGEAIDVRIVNLEVQVRDSLGRLVTGLPKEAFRVVVGPEEVPIAHFSEVRQDDPRVLEVDELDPGFSSPAAEEFETTNYLFFLDNEVTLKTRRDFVLRYLRTELDRLEPGDQAALVAFDGNRLDVLSDWSPSTKELDAVFAEAMNQPANGIMHIARRRLPGFIANWEGNASRRSILAASAAMRAVEPPPGRKVLVLVAGSWDPAELSRADDFASWCIAGNCGGLRVLRVLTDTANFLDYSIVAVDVEGRDVDLSWEREKRLQEVLTFLARETGGEVLFNKDRRRVLSRAAYAGRSYYSIAVYPPADTESLRLGIRVVVEGENLFAHTQGSFVNLTREDDEELDVLNQLLFRKREVNGFPITVGLPERIRAGRSTVPLTAAVPLAKLTWLPHGDGSYVAKFDLQVATQDARGNASEVETYEHALERSTLPGPHDFEFIDLEVTVRRRKQTLSVVIRDRGGNDSLSVVLPFEPRDRKRKKDSESPQSEAAGAP